MNAFKLAFRSFYQDTLKGIISTIRWKGSLSAEEIDFIRRLKAEKNMLRVIICGLVVAVSQISNLIVDPLTNAHPVYGAGYFYASIFLLIVSILFTAISAGNAAKEGSYTRKRFICLLYWSLFSMGTMVFSILDLMEREQLTNFTVLMVATAVFPLFDSREVGTFVIANFLVQLTAMIILKQKAFLIQQCCLGTFATMIISQIFFRSFVVTNLAEQRLERAAKTDALTGVINRRGLNDWLSKHREECVESGCVVALGMLDIDFFKSYNDSFGHVSGDACLKTVADCAADFLSEKDGIVSRYGGEEFVIILRNVSAEQAGKEIQTLKEMVEQKQIPAANQEVSKFVTISIGYVVEKIEVHSNFEQILFKADQALYRAKKHGRNLVAEFS